MSIGLHSLPQEVPTLCSIIAECAPANDGFHGAPLPPRADILVLSVDTLFNNIGCSGCKLVQASPITSRTFITYSVAMPNYCPTGRKFGQLRCGVPSLRDGSGWQVVKTLLRLKVVSEIIATTPAGDVAIGRCVVVRRARLTIDSSDGMRLTPLR